MPVLAGRLVDLFCVFGSNQKIEGATHKNGNNLDLIFSSVGLQLPFYQDVQLLSDHQPIFQLSLQHKGNADSKYLFQIEFQLNVVEFKPR